MKIVVAPDSFKGTLSASEVCDVWASAFQEVYPEAELVCVPMSDGGEGALDCVSRSAGAVLKSVEVEDPLGRTITAEYTLFPDGSAFIETARACGLVLLKDNERNPLVAGTYGVGQLIADALDSGAKSITVAIGGSATVDGGAGMLQALGFRLLDEDGKQLGRGAEELLKLRRLECSGRHSGLDDCAFRIASDVTNPLLGSNGAARVFGPQKGATPEMTEVLEASLANFADVLVKQGIVDGCDTHGDGAAGGMGFGLRALLSARTCSGAALIAETVGLSGYLDGADLLITGEGRSDSQTLCGKLPSVVAEIAASKGVPALLCSGSVEYSKDLSVKFAAVFSTVQAVEPLEKVLSNARENLFAAAKSIAGLLRIADSVK